MTGVTGAGVPAARPLLGCQVGLWSGREGRWGIPLLPADPVRAPRTRDLMRAGVLKKKPLWFDVYDAFPPLREPVFRRPRLRYGKARAPVQDILYHEDRVRA